MNDPNVQASAQSSPGLKAAVMLFIYLFFIFLPPYFESCHQPVTEGNVVALITMQLSDVDEIIIRLKASLRPPDGRVF